MLPEKIACKNCGYTGVAEIIGRPDTSVNGAFRHLGHDPYTGCLRFQCPSCDTTLGISPGDALDMNIATITGVPYTGASFGKDMVQGLSLTGLWGFVVSLASDILAALSRIG